MGKKGSLAWDQLGKWIIGIAVLIVIILVILVIKNKISLDPIRNLRFG
jgi:hypothetical protein